MKENYHHGNLKNELLETSIQMISEKGFEYLSLRKVANLCGVSHNAIYRHFESKEQLISCCRKYVTEALTERLEQTIKGMETSKLETLEALCEAYVSFYREHPTYFSALYRNSDRKIIFTLEKVEENYPPFELFRGVVCANIEKRNMTKEEGENYLFRLWSLVHGMISLFIASNVELKGDLKQEELLCKGFTID